MSDPINMSSNSSTGDNAPINISSSSVKFMDSSSVLNQTSSDENPNRNMNRIDRPHQRDFISSLITSHLRTFGPSSELYCTNISSKRTIKQFTEFLNNDELYTSGSSEDKTRNPKYIVMLDKVFFFFYSVKYLYF